MMTPYHLLLSGIMMLSVLLQSFFGIENVNSENSNEPTYHLAFANFGPLNDDIFIADANGDNARPFLPNSANDYNASFSNDGKWVVFTSERNGSADIYRVHLDGSGLEQLTDDPFFDDASFSPDGKRIALCPAETSG